MEAKAKIMVVDDEKRICENVAKILTKNDYEVYHALSAEEERWPWSLFPCLFQTLLCRA